MDTLPASSSCTWILYLHRVAVRELVHHTIDTLTALSSRTGVGPHTTDTLPASSSCTGVGPHTMDTLPASSSCTGVGPQESQVLKIHK